MVQYSNVTCEHYLNSVKIIHKVKKKKKEQLSLLFFNSLTFQGAGAARRARGERGDRGGKGNERGEKGERGREGEKRGKPRGWRKGEGEAEGRKG